MTDDGAAFGVRRRAVQILQGPHGGAGGGEGCHVFFGIKSLTRGPGEGVDQAGEGGRVATEFVFELTAREVAEGGKDLESGEMECSLIELRGVRTAAEFESRLAQLAGILTPFLVEQPVLETRAVVPVGDVFGVEGDADLAQLFADSEVSVAIPEQVVDEVTLLLGKGGDFAFGSVGSVRGRRRDRVFGCGWFWCSIHM